MTPETVVAQFIAAMHDWELSAWAARREAKSSSDPASYLPRVTAELDAVFATHCTVRERPFGRQGSFQKPPEYDPDHETVVGVELQGDRAFVQTTRVAPLGGGAYRYVLMRFQDAWRIDRLEHLDGGQWVPAVL